jgi:hypothetical protein
VQGAHFLQLFCLLCAWTIRNDRNNRLFDNVRNSISQLLNKVKHDSLCCVLRLVTLTLFSDLVRGGQAP